MSSDATTTVPALRASGLSKTFPGQRALDDVDFELLPGEVHALVGQNGSGKSTFMKVLAGYHEPDEGSAVEVDGRTLTFGDPADTLAAGLRFVHQDLALVPGLDALDNLALGRGYERHRLGTISWRREADAAREMLADLGYDFDLRAPVGRLTAAERTGLAVARALQGWEGGAKVLVLDEPTAALPAGEVERLFEVVAKLRGRVAVIYISHHFGEVFAIADRVTVLRDGRRVATRRVDELDEDQLIELTVGRAIQRMEAADHPSSATGVLAMRVTGLGGRVLTGLDFDVHKGEVLGFAGVTGSGRDEIAPLLFGAVDRDGEVEVGGKPVAAGRPHRSMAAGMALVPAERAALGTFAEMTLRENITLSSLDAFMTPLGLRKGAERAGTRDLLEKFEVSTTDSEALISQLSGGNQQKVLLGRAMRLAPEVLVLDEPTQGVDVGAKAAIHQMVDDAARDGAAVVVAATESEELIRLCDRVIVLAGGRVHAVVRPAELSAEELTQLTLGRAIHAPA
ncbi:MAG: rbsA [Solirubrobacterales bacterium]|nr:rbsA [Solirubrobacterales bacterium]